MNKRRMLPALLLCLALLLGACAAQTPEAPAEEPVPTPEPSFDLPRRPEPRRDREAESLRLYIDGLLTDRAYRTEDGVFLSPELLCEHCGLEMSLEENEAGLVMRLPGLVLEARRGEEIMEAGGRYFFTPAGWLTVNGRICLPLDVMERLLGMRAAETEDGLAFDTDALQLMVAEEHYYDMNYGEEDIYWLSHVIFAEAQSEPLAGQIGVGNVVLNRVASSQYPNTVYDVVLDQEGGVQFSSITTPVIRYNPDKNAMLATYLCLDGYSTVGDSLYYVNPLLGNTRWFDDNMSFVVTIGDHSFYA